MSYIYLSLAVIFEVVGTYFVKQSQGFTKFIPSLLIFCYYGLSFGSLTLAVKKIDVSLAYPIWTGSTMALVAIVGVLLFKETNSLLKLLSILVIILGVIGLAVSNKL